MQSGQSMQLGVLQGLAAFRWAAWVWMVVVVAVSTNHLARPAVAFPLLALALAVTVADSVALRTRPELLLSAPMVIGELAVGFALLAGDGWAYRHLSASEALGSVWPLAGVLAAGVAFGPLGGALAGIALGMARLVAVAGNSAVFDRSRVLSVTNATVFYAVGGAVAGYLVQVLNRAEREISAARAREEVARTLHDGVLQTLAVVERRSDDPTLARLAREQERELREFLFGAKPATQDLGAALRAAAARFEDSFGGRVDVIVADDLPSLSPQSIHALAGAAGEALVNAGKHGHAGHVVVYAEPDDVGDGRVFCSVKDDGCGFDLTTTLAGQGLSGSIQRRMTEAGGRAEVRSQPGAGTEVCLWL
jgi:signal transduction histidine kinase